MQWSSLHLKNKLWLTFLKSTVFEIFLCYLEIPLILKSREFHTNFFIWITCIQVWHKISTSNHIFKGDIWDKFAGFTFLKFWNLLSKTREISKLQKNERGKFSPNFTNKHDSWLIIHDKLLKSTQGLELHKK